MILKIILRTLHTYVYVQYVLKLMKVSTIKFPRENLFKVPNSTVYHGGWVVAIYYGRNVIT